jgi:5S rRNA maturation endonuclease (ribonuclease M5)
MSSRSPKRLRRPKMQTPGSIPGDSRRDAWRAAWRATDPSSAIQERVRRFVLSFFDGVRESSRPYEYTARCPGHHDENPSLSIKVHTNGKVQVHCFAGCSYQAVVDGAGLALYQGSPVVDQYVYADERGKPLYGVFRTADKQFPVRRATGEWSLGRTRRLLYRLADLIRGAKAQPKTPLFVCEGEKDVERCWANGLPATCAMGGASAKWLQEYNEPFRGRHVVVIADNDKAGEQHAQKVAAAITGIAASIKVLVFNELPEHADASDFFDLGGTARELLNRVAKCDLWQPSRDTPPTSADHSEATPAASLSNAERKDERLTHRPLSEILRELFGLTGDWPRRVGPMLFVHAGQENVDYLRTPAGLFGWLKSVIPDVRWYACPGCTTKDELFHELLRTAMSYLSIQRFPHEPKIDGYYYTKRLLKRGDGKTLDALVDRFSPATTEDRWLIKAAIVTPTWGGPFGARPIFVITASGRGHGKTALAESIGQIYGGCLAFSKQEDPLVMKQRLLSPEGMGLRIYLIDNLKSAKFSSADFESLVTAPVISGKRMFVGEGNRPNDLTPFVTVNGPNFVTDLAQRSVFVRLRKPAYSGTWQSETRQFIDANREALFADIVTFLKNPRATLAKHTRWAEWERDVLSRLPNPGKLQRVIASRQRESNVDSDLAERLVDEIRKRLQGQGYDLESQRIRIPSKVMTGWYNAALGNAVAGRVENDSLVSRIVRQLADEGQLKQVRKDPSRKHGRCFIWTGPQYKEGPTVMFEFKSRPPRPNRGDV